MAVPAEMLEALPGVPAVIALPASFADYPPPQTPSILDIQEELLQV